MAIWFLVSPRKPARKHASQNLLRDLEDLRQEIAMTMRQSVGGAQISEEAIQRTVFEHIRRRRAPGVFAFHPRSGGQDQHRLAGINVGLGVKSGVPDVVVIKDGVPFALELKTESGKLSRDQARVLRELRTVGVDADVAYGLDAAIRWLQDRGILRGRAAA
jgi:VRR-NUC domain